MLSEIKAGGCLRKWFWAFWLAAMALASAPAVQAAVSQEDMKADYGAAEARKVVEQPPRWITADHSEHEVLAQDFDSGPEVTEACLSCHNEAAEQVHKTIHWTWICPADPKGVMGKNGLTMNNF